MFEISIMEKNQVIISVEKELKQKNLDKIIKDLLIIEPIDTSVTIDLSMTIWIELDAALWLISFLNKLKIQRNDIKIIFPDPDTHSGRLIWDFLITWNFFDALKKCVDSPVNLLEINQLKYINDLKSHYKTIPLERRTITDNWGNKYQLPNRLLEIESIVNDNNYLKSIASYKENFSGFAQLAIRNYCKWDEDDTKKFVNSVVEEGLVNSFVHGENTFTNVAMKSDEKNLTLAICDNGKGIPTSLRETFNKKRDIFEERYIDANDSFLLKYFTQPEMILDSLYIDQSTHEKQGAIGRKGDGLFYLKDFVFKHGGKLRIRSGKAWVEFEYIHNKEKVEAIDDLIQSAGTLITIILPKPK